MPLVSSRMRSCVMLPSPSRPAATSPCVRAWRGARPRSSIRSGRDGGSLRYLLRLPDPPPDLLGCQRHVEIRYAKRRERIEGRADDGGGGAHGTRFATALGAKRVMSARLAFVAFRDERRQIVGSRQRVIHERPAHGLPAPVIDTRFE